MSTVISVPKNKKFLEFLSELDGPEKQLSEAWIFIRNDVVVKLYRELEQLFTRSICNTEKTFVLFHDVEDKIVTSIVLQHEPTPDEDDLPLWSMVFAIRCMEDAPFSISFARPSLLPQKVFFLIMEK